MDWKAIHGPASCSSHADMGAQLTSLMDDGMTVYCGLGALSAVEPSSPFGLCSRPSLANELSLATYPRGLHGIEPPEFQSNSSRIPVEFHT